MKEQFNQYKHLLEKPGNLAVKTTDHLAVIEQFYADDIIQIENTAAPIKGKEAIKKMEINNLKGVYSVKTSIENVLMDTETGMVWGEMVIQFDSKKLGKKRVEEAFLQKWVNGKISYLRFYYGDFLDE